MSHPSLQDVPVQTAAFVIDDKLNLTRKISGQQKSFLVAQ